MSIVKKSLYNSRYMMAVPPSHLFEYRHIVIDTPFVIDASHACLVTWGVEIRKKEEGKKKKKGGKEVKHLQFTD